MKRMARLIILILFSQVVVELVIAQTQPTQQEGGRSLKAKKRNDGARQILRCVAP